MIPIIGMNKKNFSSVTNRNGAGISRPITEKSRDMESVKNYIRENWPLAVVVTIIYVIAIALFEAHLI